MDANKDEALKMAASTMRVEGLEGNARVQNHRIETARLEVHKAKTARTDADKVVARLCRELRAIIQRNKEVTDTNARLFTETDKLKRELERFRRQLEDEKESHTACERIRGDGVSRLQGLSSVSRLLRVANGELIAYFEANHRHNGERDLRLASTLFLAIQKVLDAASSELPERFDTEMHNTISRLESFVVSFSFSSSSRGSHRSMVP